MKDPFKRAPYTGPDRRQTPSQEPATMAKPVAAGRLTAVGRHAAIGNRLTTYREYKEWVGKVRSKWDLSK
jgi:hypothetical protein